MKNGDEGKVFANFSFSPNFRFPFSVFHLYFTALSF
jgi:hypothetical protein